MDGPALRQAIAAFIRDEYLDAGQVLADDTRLISTGIVDSFSMASLRTWLEDEYGVAIADEQATAAQFDTVEGIAALVERLRT